MHLAEWGQHLCRAEGVHFAGGGRYHRDEDLGSSIVPTWVDHCQPSSSCSKVSEVHLDALVRTHTYVRVNPRALLPCCVSVLGLKRSWLPSPFVRYSPLYNATNAVNCRSRHVLELGSGLGLVGISSLLLYPLASFTFTDCHPQVLDALRENVQLQSMCAYSIGHNPIRCISCLYIHVAYIWCQTYKPLHIRTYCLSIVCWVVVFHYLVYCLLDRYVYCIGH